MMGRYSDHLLREQFPELFKGEPDPKDKLDLDRWEPSSQDGRDISQFMLESYWDTLDMCGEEEAQPYLDLFRKIKRRGIAACKDDVQGVMCDHFWAVDGEIEEYYGDSDILKMMNLTILKEPIPER